MSAELDEGFDLLTKRFQRAWMDTIEQGVARCVFRADVDTALFYRFARDAIWFSVRWRRRASETPAKLAAVASTIPLDGFADRGSAPPARR